MANVLIGYDLNRPHQDYQDLIDAIKQLGSWWHCLDSTWIVMTSLTVVQVRDALKVHIDSNDELLVVPLVQGVGAWTGFNQQCSDWLTTNLRQHLPARTRVSSWRGSMYVAVGQQRVGDQGYHAYEDQDVDVLKKFLNTWLGTRDWTPCGPLKMAWRTWSSSF